VRASHALPEGIRGRFVPTSTAARSVLAEAMRRRAGAARLEGGSAGIERTAVHELTRRVLETAGFDHDWAASTAVSDVVGQPFDYVITLCDDARLACPVFPGADQSLHWGYKDPAGVPGDEAAKIAAYDRVFRDLAER